MVSAPSYELKTRTPTTCSAWLLAIFRRKLRVGDFFFSLSEQHLWVTGMLENSPPIPPIADGLPTRKPSETSSSPLAPRQPSRSCLRRPTGWNSWKPQIGRYATPALLTACGGRRPLLETWARTVVLVDVVMRALGHRLGESGGHTLPDTAGAPARRVRRAVPSDKTVSCLE
jgi:hypothetical protein